MADKKFIPYNPLSCRRNPQPAKEFRKILAEIDAYNQSPEGEKEQRKIDMRRARTWSILNSQVFGAENF